MLKKYEKDIRFGFWAVAASFLIMAGLFVLRDYIETAGPEKPIIDKTISEIITIYPEQVPPMLARDDHKPVMLIAYASWCGPCRRSMPGIIELIQTHKLDAYHLVFISLDYTPQALGKYLVRKNYRDIFTPYMIIENKNNKLSAALAQSGSHFNEEIPYIGFFDANGQLSADFVGGFDKETLLKAAESLALEHRLAEPSVND